MSFQKFQNQGTRKVSLLRREMIADSGLFYRVMKCQFLLPPKRLSRADFSMSLALLTIYFQQVATILHFQKNFCHSLPPDLYCSTNLLFSDRATVMFSEPWIYSYCVHMMLYWQYSDLFARCAPPGIIHSSSHYLASFLMDSLQDCFIRLDHKLFIQPIRIS